MRVPRRGRGLFLVALAFVFVVAIARPTLAQSTNKAAIRNLNLKLLYLAVPLAVAVELIIVYTVYKYRNNDDPKPRSEDRQLEITWTVATALILVFVGIASITVLGNPYVTPTAGAGAPEANASNPHLQGAIQPASDDALVVEVTAYQWGWNFEYPDQNVTTHDRLVVPTDRDVYLHLQSREVLHSFYVPKLGLKQDVFPDQYNTIHTNVTETGSYELFCAEYCGSGHSQMRGHVVARSPQKYQSWLDEQHAKSGNGTTTTTTTTATSS